jgi:hypothetical protein
MGRRSVSPSGVATAVPCGMNVAAAARMALSTTRPINTAVEGDGLLITVLVVI